METEALLEGDRVKATRAADGYADLGLPFEEAVCRLMGGQSARVEELTGRFGLAEGVVATAASARGRQTT
jgi:hypothetical protein